MGKRLYLYTRWVEEKERERLCEILVECIVIGVSLEIVSLDQ